MGVHTGDSITVAPAQTLTDREYQYLRDASLAIMREIGVETGGSNIQFAVNPADGKVVVIEMNPRVSRSSALASKATGFPIAKFAAKLAVGYRLDEIDNDITKKTPACFEPSIDYVVTKIPRWAFEKFPGADETLTTKMKSVGEAMAIGRTFKESFQKACRSLETGRAGLGADGKDGDLAELDDIALEQLLAVPNEQRPWAAKEALRRGMPATEGVGLSTIDPWFVDQMAQLVEFERSRLSGVDLADLVAEAPGPGSTLLDAKRLGYSDAQLAFLTGSTELEVRKARLDAGVKPTFKTVDTCAAEFEAETPYYYSTYETEDEVRPSDAQKVMILGSGPNRIGQGIEFDYCCVHASFALKELGYESIMVNCNPETVSTDYDTSDRLYFEPLTFEDVMNIVEAERPMGVIVQFGGQTPLKLAVPLERAGVPILGTSPDSIDLAEDRKRFGELLTRLGMLAPYNGTATSVAESIEVAHDIGYPLLVRPSYVLGGRAMEIVYSDDMLADYMARAVKVSPEHPVLLDRFLEGAIEVDVDAICDGTDVMIGAVMEHIEEAGIHSGDSACAIPPYSLAAEAIEEIRQMTRRLAMELRVCGLLNIQFAVKDGEVYVLEVNPRASRTVPFVSKAIGMPLAKIAAKVMAGKTLAELGVSEAKVEGYVAIKEAVMPFGRFPGVDTVLGPEMKSTGEVMGIDETFGVAYAKSQMATDFDLPLSGTIFVSVTDRDKPAIVPIAKRLAQMGFKLISTGGTAKVLGDAGIRVAVIRKVHEGRPNVTDLIKNGDIGLIINTPLGRKTRSDGWEIRTSSAAHGIPCITTMSAADAVARGIAALRDHPPSVRSLQEWHRGAPLPGLEAASEAAEPVQRPEVEAEQMKLEG
jgi:carbamoyl-phosphate synthase large subunit